MSDIEWHDWRRGGVGGSDIAALVGLSNYASPTSLYYEKTGQLDDREEDTPRQRIGKRMEAVLAAEFLDRTGLYVVGGQTWCAHPELAWARCTADGFVAETPATNFSLIEGTLGTVEFKTDGRFGWPDGVPANIRAQCIWQLGVTGLRHCWLVVMFAGFRVEVFEIAWDDDAESDWEFMLGAATTFWDDVRTGTPPPVDDHEATTEALTQVFRDPDGYLDADDASRALVAAVRSAMAATKAAKAEEARAKNELRALLGDRTELVDGWLMKLREKSRPVVIASWREQQASNTDMDGLRAAAPDLVDKFTTKQTVRVLRVPKPKEE